MKRQTTSRRKAVSFGLALTVSAVLALPAIAEDPLVSARRVLYNFDGDSCLSTKAGGKGPVPVNVDDVKRHLAWDPKRALGAVCAKMNPLHQAILRRKPDLVALLLEAGASPLTPDSSGRSPLHLAVERGDAGLVAMLLKAGADPSVRDGRGWTPLHHAAAKNQLEIARMLLDAPTDPNILSELGGTPLHEAAASGSVALAKLLVERGTNPAIRSKPGVTALDIAREYKNAEVIAYLEGLAK